MLVVWWEVAVSYENFPCFSQMCSATCLMVMWHIEAPSSDTSSCQRVVWEVLSKGELLAHEVILRGNYKVTLCLCKVVG